MGGNELEVLEHYNRKIEKYGEHKDAAEILLKCLSKLDQVRVNINLLQNTGIGRTVSTLKKRYGDHEIGTRSRDLVNKWKDLVAKEENEEEANSEENEEEDNGEGGPGAQQTDKEPPTYIPTPIAPAYTPTPIDELPTVAEASNVYADMNDNADSKKKAKSQPREKSSEKESDHHKSKKKKSHRERRSSEEKEESHSSENGKSERDKKEKERSHKHRHSDKERESKHGDKDRSSRDRSKDHKSSKSSHKDKSRDSESDRKSDNKHGDKDKHRTKDKSSKPRIKEEKCDSNDKVKPKESFGSSGAKIKEESIDSGYGDVKHKIKKEPLENGFDFMKENDLHESSKSKDKAKRSKDKSKEDESKRKSKSRELASVDIFSKSMDNTDDEAKARKRSRDEEYNSKSKRPKPDASQKFVLPAPPSFLPPLPTGPSLIPEISPVYKPLPRAPLQNMDRVVDDRNTDEESLSILLSNKNKNRAAIYSGTKRKGFYGEVPSLFSQCIQVLKDHVDDIDEVGNLGYDILQPVLDRASPQTLMHIEDCNPYLMEDTAELWEKYVKKDFRNKEREDLESWREMYERCTVERAEKLDALKGKVKQCYKAEEDNHRKTKLAYVDIAPKAPRSVRNAQAKHGTALPVGHSMVAGAARPRNQIGDPTASSSRAGVTSKKPRTAPMMAKTLKLMKGIKGGFRR